MNFQKHTSAALVDLFNQKPYQGQSPEKANIIFLSSDANYSPGISNHPFFNYILEYQSNGVAFWQKYDCHHPFLLDVYPFSKTRDGVPYHRNFSKIGLNVDYADKVCFLELLDIPTIGNKSENRGLFFDLISYPHLQYIDDLMQGGGHKLFFVSSGVLKDMMKLKKKHDVFHWLGNEQTKKHLFSKTVNENRVQEIYHFSAYQIHRQVDDIYLTINAWLKQRDLGLINADIQLLTK